MVVYVLRVVNLRDFLPGPLTSSSTQVPPTTPVPFTVQSERKSRRRCGPQVVYEKLIYLLL